MRLYATIGERQSDVQLRDEGARVVVDIDNRQHEFSAHETAAGFLLICGGQVFNCRVEGRPESGKPLDVIVGTKRYAIVLTDPKRWRGATAVGAHPVEAAHMVAPMPGKVVRVLVEAGAEVEAGEGIVVVEAMKMQNEMKSPKAGTVVAVNVQVGATVNGGDVLAVIE